MKIYFRVCELQNQAISYVERWQKLTKDKILRKTWLSLMASVKDDTDEVIIIHDKVTPETLAWLDKTARGLFRFVQVPEHTWEYHAHTVTLIEELEKTINNGQELEYHFLVEDDYLFLPGALDVIRGIEKHWKGFIVPYDYPDRYMHPEPCVVMAGPDRHWRTINSCTMTIAAPGYRFKEMMPQLKEAAPTSNDKIFEPVFKTVQCISPLPAIATHLTQHHNSPYVSVAELWNSIQL